MIKQFLKYEFWKLKVDIMIPAAMEMQIDHVIANTLDCQMVVEGANGPTTLKGDYVLKTRNIEVIPDILANSGGVLVSYFEWLQNRSDNYWSLEEVETKLKNMMYRTCDQLFRMKHDDVDVSNRVLVYKISLDILEKYYEIKGF